MDWEKLLYNYGPVAPIVLILLKAHWDLVYKLHPDAVKTITKALNDQREHADRRHKQTVDWMHNITDALNGVPCANGKPPKKKSRARQRSASKKRKATRGE